MFKKIVLFLFIVSFVRMPAQNICLSFDDAPMGDGLRFKGAERTKILISKFKSSKISPIIFSVPYNLDSAGITRLQQYSDAGVIIGNHTFSHGDIEKMGPARYLNDIFKADSVLAQFKKYKKIFRYPYLNEGKKAQVRDTVRNILSENGFSFGYVTVDTYDWYINNLYQTALKEGKSVNYEVLKNLYIDHVWSSITFYDDIAKKVLARSPNHIVLLHENDLSALFIDELVKFLREKGCNFISPEEAYSDKIAYQGMSTLINNQGKIGAIAREMGYSGSIWPETEEEEIINALFEKSEVFR